ARHSPRLQASRLTTCDSQLRPNLDRISPATSFLAWIASRRVPPAPGRPLPTGVELGIHGPRSTRGPPNRKTSLHDANPQRLHTTETTPCRPRERRSARAPSPPTTGATAPPSAPRCRPSPPG